MCVKDIFTPHLWKRLRNIFLKNIGKRMNEKLRKIWRNVVNRCGMINAERGVGVVVDMLQHSVKRLVVEVGDI